MTETAPKISRKEQILQALAHMLEVSPGARITTANLAKEVGVSEAALYRHFPSKAKMFEGLIEFIEETIFSRIKIITTDHSDALARCENTMFLMLSFAERNPGMCRILMGDALAGETDRLRQRIQQLFERLETQLKQFLREAELREGKRPQVNVSASANLLVAVVEGRIRQFVRSEFKSKPTQFWAEQWKITSNSLF
jgi:TetR/AcrR family transcriptional regulator